MLNYLDILDRAQTGPYISEENWDLEKIAMTTRRLVKKYKLEWNPNELVTDDAALSDAIWKAGYEMAVELGSYSRSTERIIQLSQDEIDGGIRNMPQEVVMGEGKDARTLYARHLNDERAPLFFGGSPGTPIPEKIFLANVISYMQEPLIDLATCGTLVEVDGREVRTGNPIEIVSTRRELQYMRQGLKRVGRAGMGMLAEDGPTLYAAADAHGVDLYFEAAEAASNPIKRTITESLARDAVTKVRFPNWAISPQRIPIIYARAIRILCPC